jgi:hypothetical protein
MADSISEHCRETGFQNCFYCDNLNCGDRAVEVKIIQGHQERIRQLEADLFRLGTEHDKAVALLHQIFVTPAKVFELKDQIVEVFVEHGGYY